MCKVPRFAPCFWPLAWGTTPHDTSLLGRSSRLRTFGCELQDGHELLQSDFEDLANFHERLALGNGVQDGSQWVI